MWNLFFRSQRGMKIYFTENIQEVNEMVVDCGAPKTIIGEPYLEYMKQNNLKDNELEKTLCKLRFR